MVDDRQRLKRIDPGLPFRGEAGDLIAVGAPGNRARVLEVDRENGMLHLDRELEWEAGAPVAFPWSGAGPDLGVYEHGEDDYEDKNIRFISRWNHRRL